MFVSKELIHVYNKAQEILMPNLWISEGIRLPDTWGSKLLKSSMTPLHLLHYTFLRVVQKSLFMGTLMIDTSWKKSTQQWSSRSTNIMDFNITGCFYKVIWVSKNTFTVNSDNKIKESHGQRPYKQHDRLCKIWQWIVWRLKLSPSCQNQTLFQMFKLHSIESAFMSNIFNLVNHHENYFVPLSIVTSLYHSSALDLVLPSSFFSWQVM